MNNIIDFSKCERMHVSYGGSDRKFGVSYEGNTYMLKFSEHHAKKSDISTSYTNNVISEYISSHISQSIGLPTHETVLGLYKGEIVVGCKDFRKSKDVTSMEFAEYVRAKYDSKEIGRIVKLQQIYDTIKDPENAIPKELQEKTVERYWDTFVVDALVGNFDRHVGNWGYLVHNGEMTLAPVYDYGSTLFPQLSDEGILEIDSNDYETFKRCFLYPSPALACTYEKTGKVGYYDILSSNYDKNCTEALLRIAPRIDMNKISEIINNTPFITDIKRNFYKSMIQIRNDVIIQRAFVRCLYKEYDMAAKHRIINGKQFSEEDLQAFINGRHLAKSSFEENEKYMSNIQAPKHDNKTKEIAEAQRALIEQYGFCSRYLTFSLEDQFVSREITHKDYNISGRGD